MERSADHSVLVARRVVNSIVLSLGLVLTLAAFFQSPEDQLNRGITLIKEKRFTEAVSLFNQVKQNNPQEARAYFYTGMALTESGRLTAAALELSEAVRLDAQRPEYRIVQANIFARLKQSSHAKDTLETLTAVATEKLEASWLWLLVDTYYRVERLEDTMRMLDLMEKRFPDDPRLDLNRGQVYSLQNKFDLALNAFRRSAAKHPENALVHFELGKLFYQRDDLPAAKSSLLEAVRLEKNNPQYLQKLGAVLLASSKLDEAIAYLERAAAIEPDSVEINYSLSQAWRRKGERQKASQFIDKFQELKHREEKTEQLERVLARGERLLDEGKNEEARASFEEVVQADSSNWTAHGYLAEMFLDAGEPQRAWPHLSRMEELDRESVVGKYLTARYWFARTELERAREYAETVKQSRPAHAQLRNLLGQIYLGLKQPEKAKEEFKAAVRLAPDRQDFRENLQKLERLQER